MPESPQNSSTSPGSGSSLNVRWVYAAGGEWVPFNNEAQEEIETLWNNGVAHGSVMHHGDPVYVHFDPELYVVVNNDRRLMSRTLLN